MWGGRYKTDCVCVPLYPTSAPGSNKWGQLIVAHNVECTGFFTARRRQLTIDRCHVTHYTLRMIKSFADKETQQLYVTGKSRRLPPDIVKPALRRLEYVHLAQVLDDLKVPPSNRLHGLRGDREGQHSISINDQWRICFRFRDGDAYDVEITDYH